MNCRPHEVCVHYLPIVCNHVSQCLSLWELLDLPQVLKKGEQGVTSSKDPAKAPLPAGHGFVVGKDLVCQLVDKLIKAKVHLVRRKQGGQGVLSG